MEENHEREKVEAGEIVVENKFVKWISNVWYHFKWHIIVGLFFIAVIAICFVQCATKPQFDLTIAYAGFASVDPDDAENLTAEEQDEIAKILASLLPEHEDGTSVSISFSRFKMYSEAEMEKLYTNSETAEGQLETKGLVQQMNREEHESFSNFVLTGQSSFWFVSEYVYNNVVDKSRLATLESLGLTSNAAIDAYAIRLSSLPIYNEFDVLRNLPDDTLIVLSQKTIVGEASEDDVYSLYTQLFCNIVNWKKT